MFKRKKKTIVTTSMGLKGKTKEQKNVIKYFMTGGCLNKRMSDEQYDMLDRYYQFYSCIMQ